MKRLTGLLTAAILAVSACGGSSTADESAGVAVDRIGVSGQWHIDVVDPDGTIDESIDFHNEFVGQKTLADLLSMATTQTGWYIRASPLADSICAPANVGCEISPASAARDASTDELIVSGSFQADFTGDITRVDAGIVTTELGNQTISSKDLRLEPSGAIAVAAGQTVQIEIRYSFSTV